MEIANTGIDLRLRKKVVGNVQDYSWPNKWILETAKTG